MLAEIVWLISGAVVSVDTTATAPFAKEYNRRYDHLMAWAHSSNGPIKYSPDSIYTFANVILWLLTQNG